MLTHLTVQNYRVLRDLRIDLAPLTVLVGPNAVGKSTLLEALQQLTLIAQKMGTIPGDPWSRLMRLETTTDEKISFIVDRNPSWPEDMSLSNYWPFKSPNGSRSVPTLHRITEGNQSVGKIGWEWERQFIPSANGSDAEWPASFPRRTLRLHLNPDALRSDDEGLISSGQIDEHGKGLAAALNDLKANDDSRFDFILEAMRQVVPGLKTIKAPRVRYPHSDVTRFSIRCSTTNCDEITAQHMSDGTLYSLALLTVLSSCQGKNTLVLLDDIDQGLHPKAQAELIAQIRKIQANTPGLQVVATCHSPYLVDCLEGHEVVLMHPDKDGFAQAKRLSDHPDYARLKGALGTGEFWGSVGEEWVNAPATTAAP